MSDVPTVLLQDDERRWYRRQYLNEIGVVWLFDEGKLLSRFMFEGKTYRVIGVNPALGCLIEER